MELFQGQGFRWGNFCQMEQNYFRDLVLLSLAAGAAIPVGGAFGAISSIYPKWLNEEWKHGIIAFGGGALISAVALVLVPEGSHYLSDFWSISAVISGGVAFAFIDAMLSPHGGSASQLMAMILDFVPEAMALGAALVLGEGSAFLIAFLIAIQNLPEGFNAFREIKVTSDFNAGKLLMIFAGIALIGPASALVGSEILARQTAWLGFVMLFSSGGILFLTFRDIAPASRLDRHWLPSLGAVLGFALGLLGHLFNQ